MQNGISSSRFKLRFATLFCAIILPHKSVRKGVTLCGLFQCGRSAHHPFPGKAHAAAAEPKGEAND